MSWSLFHDVISPVEMSWSMPEEEISMPLLSWQDVCLSIINSELSMSAKFSEMSICPWKILVPTILNKRILV